MTALHQSSLEDTNLTVKTKEWSFSHEVKYLWRKNFTYIAHWEEIGIFEKNYLVIVVS